MAQKQLDRFDSPDPVYATLNYNHPTTLRETMNYYQSITESQDATDLELACLDQEKPATKEDFALLMASLDGSINNLMNLANEFSEIRKSITNDLQALSEHVGEIKNETRNTTPDTSKIPTRKTNPCYICKELGHLAPECSQTQDPPKKSKDKDPCYICQNLGHWASECPEKENNPPIGDKKKNPSPRKPNLKRENTIQNNSEPPKKKSKLALPKKK